LLFGELIVSLSERMLLRQLQKTAPHVAVRNLGPAAAARIWQQVDSKARLFIRLSLSGRAVLSAVRQGLPQSTPFDLQPVATLEIQVQLGPGGNSAVTNKSFEFLGMGGAPVWCIIR
jgi:hypothetical protein